MSFGTFACVTLISAVVCVGVLKLVKLDRAEQVAPDGPAFAPARSPIAKGALLQTERYIEKTQRNGECMSKIGGRLLEHYPITQVNKRSAALLFAVINSSVLLLSAHVNGGLARHELNRLLLAPAAAHTFFNVLSTVGSLEMTGAIRAMKLLGYLGINCALVAGWKGTMYYFSMCLGIYSTILVWGVWLYMGLYVHRHAENHTALLHTTGKTGHYCFQLNIIDLTVVFIVLLVCILVKTVTRAPSDFIVYAGMAVPLYFIFTAIVRYKNSASPSTAQLLYNLALHSFIALSIVFTPLEFHELHELGCLVWISMWVLLNYGAMHTPGYVLVSSHYIQTAEDISAIS